MMQWFIGTNIENGSLEKGLLTSFLLVITCALPLLAIDGSMLREAVSSELTKEDYKNNDAQNIRNFIREQKLSRVLITVGLNDPGKEFHQEFGEVRNNQINAKLQRVLNALQGVDYSIVEKIDELGEITLDTTVDGFELLANNPDVHSIFSPTYSRYLDARSPIRVPETNIDPNRQILLPPPSETRQRILEKWRQGVVSKLDAGDKFVNVVIVLSTPAQREISSWPAKAQKKFRKMDQRQVDEILANTARMDAIEHFYKTLSGIRYKSQKGYLTDPPSVTLQIDESAIDRVISNQNVINALVR